jgi:hypothetical protein
MLTHLALLLNQILKAMRYATPGHPGKMHEHEVENNSDDICNRDNGGFFVCKSVTRDAPRHGLLIARHAPR